MRTISGLAVLALCLIFVTCQSVNAKKQKKDEEPTIAFDSGFPKATLKDKSHAIEAKGTFTINKETHKDPVIVLQVKAKGGKGVSDANGKIADGGKWGNCFVQNLALGKYEVRVQLLATNKKTGKLEILKNSPQDVKVDDKVKEQWIDIEIEKK